MQIKGQILNTFSYEPLRGAKIALYCRSGNIPVGETDILGYFTVDVPDAISPLIFSAPGFMSVLTDPGTIEDTGQLTLTPSEDPDHVEVIAGGNAGKTDIPWWAVVGGGLLIGSASKRKISGADYSGYILPIGIVLLGVYAVSKLGDLFTGDNADNNTAIKNANSEATQSSINQAQSAGIPQTFSDSQLSGAATSIYTIGSKQNGPGSAGDQNQISDTLIGSSGTLTDLLKIKQFFGTKKVSTGWLSTCYALGFNCNAVDLDAFLHLALDPSHISYINGYFRNKGINYTI